MSSKFRFRNRFWFRETFIYASRSFTDDFLGNRFGFVCFDCPKDSSSQSVKPPVCAAETPAVIFLKKKKTWTVTSPPLDRRRASFSSDSSWKINTAARLTFQATKLTNQKGWDGRVLFGFAVRGRKKINAAWLNFKCRGDWGGGGGGMLLRMWLYNERTIHRLQLEISWVS